MFKAAANDEAERRTEAEMRILLRGLTQLKKEMQMTVSLPSLRELLERRNNLDHCLHQLLWKKVGLYEEDRL